MNWWWVLPIGFLAIMVESRWFKGKIGEHLVSRSMRKHLDPAKYHTLHDVTLRTDRGTTQIDHIVFSAFGIFVIETKNMSGWIFGRTGDMQWTQTFHRKKFRFQNPLRQNYKHIKAVAQAAAIHESKLHSLVIFTGSAKFKTPMPPNVCRRSAGVMHIRTFQERLLMDNEVSEAILKITERRLAPGLKTNRAHIKQIRENKELPSCDKCGSPMVLKTATKGTNAGNQFWGCSSYPKCSYTRDHLVEPRHRNNN